MRSATASSLVVGVVAFLLMGGLIVEFSLRGLAEEAPTIAKDKPEASPQLPGRYVHVALYTFKSDLPDGTLVAFAADAEKCFSQIPEIRGFQVGSPASQATPKVWMVEPKGDFHVGVVLCLDGFKGLAKYANHPKHNELKQKYAKFFEKIVVYDFQG